MTLLINLWGGLMALLFPQPKERRKNRAVPDAYVIRYARLHKALVEIMNTTNSDMSAEAFRDWARDKAHEAINRVEGI